MTDEQLQKAIEKYVTIIVGDGVRLEHHQKFFYEKLSSVAIKLMLIQTERAGLVSKEDAQEFEKMKSLGDTAQSFASYVRNMKTCPPCHGDCNQGRTCPARNV